MNHRIKSLDGLRGILCLLVVFHHYDAKYIPSYFYNNFLIRQADLLVDFFFIISGFVISYNYKYFKSIKDVGNFLKKRFLRLYPLLFFSTTVFFLFELFSRNYYSNFINKEINNLSLLKSFIDTLLLNNSTVLFGNSWGINRPTWSISAEFYAYLTFSVCLFLTGKKFKKTILSIIFLCNLYLLFLLKTSGEFNNAEHGFIRCINLFILGILVNDLSFKYFEKKGFIDIIFAAVSIIVLYVNKVMISSNSLHAVFELIVIPFLFAGIIYYLINGNGSFSALLISQTLQSLGKYSYSIYLNHAIILLAVPKILFQVFKISNNTFSELAVMSICILLILIYSRLTYRFIEQKFYLYKSLRQIRE